MKKILLSIKPNYVKEILAGRKRVEYRKRIPRDNSVKQVLIYSSYPVKRVGAEFTIGGFLKGAPEWLWNKTAEIGCVSKEFFDNYFEGKSIAFAYKIEDLIIFETPKTLKEYGMEKGPQDYCYVELDVISLR